MALTISANPTINASSMYADVPVSFQAGTAPFNLPTHAHWTSDAVASWSGKHAYITTATFNNTTKTATVYGRRVFWASDSLTFRFYFSSNQSITQGATFTNNGQTFTALETISSASSILMSGTGAPTASGTLTGGSNPAFTAYTPLGWSNVDVAKIAVAGGNFANVSKTNAVNDWSNSRAVGSNCLTNTDVFYEFTTAETNTEKAGGLTLAANSAGDPTSVGGVGVWYDYMWHLLADGTAVCRYQGNIIGSAVTYTTSSVFRVHRNGTTVTWYHNDVAITTLTVTSGTLDLYYVALLKTQNATIQNNVFFMDTGGNRSGASTFQLYGVVPVQPNYALDMSSDNNTLISVAEDRSVVARVKGGLKKSYNLVYTTRPFAEYQLMFDFWTWHQKHRNFYFRDLVLDIIPLCMFTTEFKVSMVGADQFNITIGMREV